MDHRGQPTALGGFGGDEQTNARLGDVYFIGEEQLNGGLSSPRFDEQGTASTLYALASAQSCRFGTEAIPAAALGLPRAFARVLDGRSNADPGNPPPGGRRLPGGDGQACPDRHRPPAGADAHEPAADQGRTGPGHGERSL
ncbi:MAG: hypothetical protein U5L11_06820 [Arhodomonas sp.]|nr:hypothetical protein [Arhodomonas sp.]